MVRFSLFSFSLLSLLTIDLLSLVLCSRIILFSSAHLEVIELLTADFLTLHRLATY